MTVALIFYTLLLFVGLVITEEIFHRYPRFSLAFFSIASVVLFSCWILLVGAADWFPWAKVFSIASGIIVLSLLRTTKLGSNAKLVAWTTYAFLTVNILEATVRDAVVGNMANYLNAVAGFLLIVTLEKLRTVHIDKKESHRDLLWSGMTLPWIVGYTLWNWVFVYLNFGFQSSAMHIAVLGAAFLVVFRNKDRWLQARAFTLGMYFILFHSLPHLVPSLTINRSTDQLALIISLVPFGFMVGYAILSLRRVRASK
ncbi:hypothetical protein EPN81_02935 [Patescibacteria group bacterium]|nr:MAG: hypothetical protein EPN81_02935 [Patescibacteria group bacterium]